MTVLIQSVMATVLLLGATAPMALASGVLIQTNRVQVRVDDNSGVQIQTSAHSPIVLNADADLPTLPTARSPLPTAYPAGVGCSVHSQSSHSQTHRITPMGDRIYTENYSTIRLCQ